MKCLAIPLLVGLFLSASAMAAAPLGMAILPMPPAVDPRCTLSVSNPAVDYGQVSRWQLEDLAGSSRLLTFGKRSVSVSVSCPYTQTIGLALRGDRASNGDLRYGSRGHTRMHLQGAQLDGKDVAVISSRTDGMASAATSNELALKPGQILAPALEGQPATGKVFIVHLELEPIVPEGEARVSSHQRLESNLRFDLLK